MSRYVDLSEEIYLCDDTEYETYNVRINAPSIDIVTCDECKWFDEDNTGATYCMSAQGLCNATDEDFCSHGERRGQ